MNKKKAIIVMSLWIIGVVGFLVGISMQISFEETTEFLTQRDLGKIISFVSLFLIAIGWMLKKFDDI